MILFFALLRLAGEKVIDFVNRWVESLEDLKQYGLDLFPSDTVPNNDPILCMLLLRALQIGMQDLRGCLTAAGAALNYTEMVKHIRFTFRRFGQSDLDKNGCVWCTMMADADVMRDGDRNRMIGATRVMMARTSEYSIMNTPNE